MAEFEERYVRWLAAQDAEEEKSATLIEQYAAVGGAIMEKVAAAWSNPAKGKTACYFSAEFLIGRVIYANLLNLGELEEMRRAFRQRGLDPALFTQVDDAALGNGGLGRLAACFLDSAATLGKKLDGYGIRYKYGLFKQEIENGFQVEHPDDWQRFGDPFSICRPEEKVLVEFAEGPVWAVPYDMPVIGYGGKTVNNLRLWQAEPVQAFDFARFDKQEYSGAYQKLIEALSIHSVLYPNDDTEEGKKLRLRQQYFFSSASIQSILRDFEKAGGKQWEKLPEHYAVQLNDTHPTVAIPELLRVLMQRECMPFDEAFAIVQKVFAYTNHTVMAEALEKWDVALFGSVIPEVYAYVVMIWDRLRRELEKKGITGPSRRPYEIVQEGRVHMARLAVYATHSTNGVAALHTEILKKKTLKEWYALYPERFNNKTNGVTQRRWLALCNPALAAFVTERIGPGWLTDLSEMEKLRPYADDTASLEALAAIKRENKQNLVSHLRKSQGVELSADSLFDVQVKRLHEYKRQLLNAFSILELYFRIQDGTLPSGFTPMTFLFGAKSAPGYRRAKGIIKFINEVAKRIEADPLAREKIRVYFVPDYNVSMAERMIPAAELSEQISTAGTEASGTGNMKLMMNGAPTLGTYDGANVEIVQQAGEENNYIFGARVEELEKLGDAYNPMTIYKKDPSVRRVLDTLVDGSLDDDGTGMFEELYRSLLYGKVWHRPDQYFLLLDFPDYVKTKLRANADYSDERAFQRKCLLNIAACGMFSSDRTVQQYAQEIWGL
ncbi:glycogen/starch/alpha-glucan phosphorylase [Ruminococcaceae bacterium OttesenSCG-928-I18]|nr:glycogen/starch/alpha-glucan phosphorylase [Ruminococcaceae bacterium OttesenSCG-928-I18]